MIGLGPLYNEEETRASEFAHPPPPTISPPCEVTEEGGHPHRPGRGPSPNLPVMWDFSVSRNVINKCVLFYPPNICYFVIVVQLD